MTTFSSTHIHLPLGERSYDITISQSLFSKAHCAELAVLLAQYQDHRIVIITNDVVAPLYLQSCQKLLRSASVSTWQRESILEVVLPDGEQHKVQSSLDKIFDQMLAANCQRKTLVIALGGGVIGDMAGFAASCYVRGVPFVQFPTTLLSQVDSSVGGKTAINHPLGKNMIGAFYQPKFVMIDVNTLETLPDRELSAGLAEVLKYGYIRDAGFVDWFDENLDKLLARDKQALADAIAFSCKMKASIVAEDEQKRGARALLNFGHTFGHAIEAQMGYGKWLHGEAVSAGMLLAAKLSCQLGQIDAVAVERLQTLLSRANLPVQPPESMQLDDFYRHMLRDKKTEQSSLRFILLREVGDAYVEDGVEKQDLAMLL